MGDPGAELASTVELEMTADAAHALWLGRVQPGSLAETLTRAEAQARCLAEGISLFSLARLTTCINDLLLP